MKTAQADIKSREEKSWTIFNDSPSAAKMVHPKINELPQRNNTL